MSRVVKLRTLQLSLLERLQNLSLKLELPNLETPEATSFQVALKPESTSRICWCLSWRHLEQMLLLHPCAGRWRSTRIRGAKQADS